MGWGGRFFKDPNHVHVAQVLVSKAFERCQEVLLQLGFRVVILRREQKFPSKADRFFRNFYCRLSKDFRRIGGDSSAWDVKNYPTLGCTRKAEEGSTVDRGDPKPSSNLGRSAPPTLPADWQS